MNVSKSAVASDGRLEIGLEIEPGIEMDRVPMHTARLRFRNVSSEPVRFYLPRPEAFRATISSLTLVPRQGHPMFEPEPQPHGYVVTEDDFHLLAPGEAREFTQRFTLDPFLPGPGNKTARRRGFEPGREVEVGWVYENSITRWAGGALTLDGPTKQLFDGGDIPHIWTGKLRVTMSWVVPQ